MEFHEDIARVERLIFKVARSTMRRLLAAGVKSATLDDVAQEYRIAWLVASRSYDPNMGVPWIPYLLNGLRAHTFTVMRKFTFKLKNEAYALSIWDDKGVNGSDGDESSGVLEGRIAGATVDPVDEIHRAQMLARAMRKLSPRAGIFVKLLAENPPEISEQVMRLKDKAAFGRQMGLRTGANMTVTAAMIFDLMDANALERGMILKEVRAYGEKICRK